MENPIINNRIVSSVTYAVRNLSLLLDLYPEYPLSGPMDEDEYEYMVRVTCDLLRYQVETCPENEKYYFENLVKGYKSADDIIINFICNRKPDAVRFLKAIGGVKDRKMVEKYLKEHKTIE